jgi:hypothetical protein
MMARIPARTVYSISNGRSTGMIRRLVPDADDTAMPLFAVRRGRTRTLPSADRRLSAEAADEVGPFGCSAFGHANGRNGHHANPAASRCFG